VRNARIQTQLISDLLDVSRITLGKLEITKEPVDLSDVVSSSLDSMRALAQDAGVTLVADLGADMGCVDGDQLRLQQLINNLVGNAIKFSSKGGSVRVTTHRDGPNAVATVSDDGAGIDPAILPLLFDRFWQADTTSRRTHSGLGLGLAIVRHVAQMHGGSVRAESAGPGQGAVFTVTLPLMPEADSVSVTAPRPRPAFVESADLHGLRVLIVDDDEDGRLWVKRMVVGAGAEAVDVADVGQALAAVETFRPHVLVSDLAMPVRDGFDLLGFLRSRGHSPAVLPAIALSAFAASEHKQRALAASYAAFFAKPPEPHELLAAIAKFGSARRSLFATTRNAP
jgi:CheY-like chemotaxis protein/two-component sensor histidine kinase